jgi:hypothetical protein
LVVLLDQAQHSSVAMDDQLRNAVIALQSSAHACKKTPGDLKGQLQVYIRHRQSHYQSKLTPSQIRRLKALWAETVHNGQRYGALTRLAQHFGVSTGTVKKILAMPDITQGD